MSIANVLMSLNSNKNDKTKNRNPYRRTLYL